RGWTATSQSMRPAVRRAPTRRAPCADGPAGSSVQWAVADTACCQPGQVLLQAVPEVLPAGAVPPGDLAEGAQPREEHVLQVLAGGHVLPPQLSLHPEQQVTLLLAGAGGQLLGVVDVLERGQTPERQRLVLGVGLVVVQVHRCRAGVHT